MKKVLLKGYYDFTNFGDDLLLIAIVDFLNQAFPSEQKELYYEKQHDSLVLLDENRFGLEPFEEPIKHFVKRLKEKNLSKWLIAVLTFLSFGVMYVNCLIYRTTSLKLLCPKTIDYFKNLDVIHYIGGGYFTDIWHFSFQYIIYELLLLHYAKLINPNLKIVATGIGVGPVKTSFYPILLKQFFSLFNNVVVREVKSYQTLLKAGITHAKFITDDVVLLKPRLQKAVLNLEGSDEKVLGFNLKNDKDHDYNEIATEVVKLLEAAKEEGYAVRFLCFGIDQNVLSCLNERNPHLDIEVVNPYEQDFQTFLEKFVTTSVSFGFAYHYAIVSCLFEKSTTCVYANDYYQQKVGGVLSQLSPEQSVLHLNDFLKLDFETLKQTAAKQISHEETDKQYQMLLDEYTSIYKHFGFQ
ncbi:MAG: polysaccharide pyruvyl transferase family protein [Vampirovibrionales bacterium]